MADADLTQIDGVDVMTAMTILSEVGWGMSKWKTEHQTQMIARRSPHLEQEGQVWDFSFSSGSPDSCRCD